MSKVEASEVATANASRAAMSRLTAIAGHDLKPPLHVAMLSVARAVEEGIPTAAADRLRIALDAVKRLNSELNDIARLSQMIGALRPNRRIVRVAEVLSRVECDWRFYAEARGIELDVSLSDFLVETDPDMLHTILRNFVGNSLEYSVPGGHIRVSCRVLCDPLSVEAEDDGCGIAASRLERNFEAFERGDQAAQCDGLGLGLTIGRQIADLLNHSISVQSIENEGSIFSIELPRLLSYAGRLEPAGAICRASKSR